MMRALAHPPRQKHLTNRVVDLVRAGVIQVLPLEPAPSVPTSSENRGASLNGEGRPT